MIYASEVIGLPVVSYETGEKIDRVKDIVLDSETNMVRGMVVDAAGLFSKGRVIPYQSIQSIGEDALVINDPSAIVPAEQDDAISAAMTDGIDIKGKKVMTEDGKNLGEVADIGFDPDTGQVEGYVMSGGMFEDLYKGTAFIPAPHVLKMGDDVLFVPNQTVDTVEARTGGLKGTAQSASQKVRETGRDLKEKGAWESMKSESSSIWERTKEKLQEFRKEAGEELEENAIKRAVGKPVSRVILDKSDQVILNTGDIITNEAIEQARQAGVLDVLLSSVYTKGPRLTTKDLKAKTKSRTR